MLKNIAISILLLFCSSQEIFSENIQNLYFADIRPELLPIIGYERGTGIGVSGDVIVLAGGKVNNEIYSDKIYFYKKSNAELLSIDVFSLPQGLAFPQVLNDGSVFYILGGYHIDGLNKGFYRYELNNGLINSTELSSLPFDKLMTNAVHFQNKIWVGGIKDSLSGYWTYSLSGPGNGWEFGFEEEFTDEVIISAQSDGKSRRLVQFQRDNISGYYNIYYLYDDGFRFIKALEKDTQKLIDAYPSGFSSVILVFKSDSDDNLIEVYQYNTVTTEISPIIFPNIDFLVAAWKTIDEFILISKQDEEFFVSFLPKLRRTGLQSADIVVLVVYFALLILMGYYFSRRNKSIDDYFRGGKRTPGWAAGISIMITALSPVSFMSLPAVSFTSNLTYIFMPVGNLIAVFFVIFLILPFYIRLNITSAYEYLELRFNPRIRLIGSLIFIAGVLFRVGIIILLPALIISVVTGFSIFVCIILMGIISTVYTYLGGIEAVIWSDVLQVSILIIGVLYGIGFIFYQLDFNFTQIFETARIHDKLKFADTDLDLSKVTIWVVILYSIGKINVFLSNQTIIQRLVSARNEREAGKSMIYNAVLGIPLFVILLVLGTLLFVFYHNFPGTLSPFLESQDEIVPNFLISELPVGFSGLLIAAIFAVSMSSLDSTINSTATVITKDLYIRYNWEKLFRIDSFPFARYMTGILGLFGTLTAIQLAKFEITSIFNVFIEIIGIFGGGIAGVFLLGIISVRGNSPGALIGLIISILLIYYIKGYTNLHFFLFAFIGLISSYLFGYLFSMVFRPGSKNLDGLTIFTLNNKK